MPIIVIAVTQATSIPSQHFLLFEEHRRREVTTCFLMLVLGIDVKVLYYAVLVTEAVMYFFMLVIYGAN